MAKTVSQKPEKGIKSTITHQYIKIYEYKIFIDMVIIINLR